MQENNTTTAAAQQQQQQHQHSGVMAAVCVVSSIVCEVLKQRRIVLRNAVWVGRVKNESVLYHTIYTRAPGIHGHAQAASAVAAIAARGAKHRP